MTPEERIQVAALVAKINIEKDHDKFTELVRELNDLLEAKERRLDIRPSFSKSQG